MAFLSEPTTEGKTPFLEEVVAGQSFTASVKLSKKL